MKIYTKTGDKGHTGLIGGKRVPKHDLRIEAYGSVDELNSHIGLLRDLTAKGESKNILIEIQDRLFTIGSQLACETKKESIKIPGLKDTDITLLEGEIDKMNEQLPPLSSFILPGGHITVSTTHIARCVCRRAERCVVHLSTESEVDEIILKYLNRLSDYLFVLARKFADELKAEEIAWKPRL